MLCVQTIHVFSSCRSPAGAREAFWAAVGLPLVPLPKKFGLLLSVHRRGLAWRADATSGYLVLIGNWIAVARSLSSQLVLLLVQLLQTHYLLVPLISTLIPVLDWCSLDRGNRTDVSVSLHGFEGRATDRFVVEQ